MKLDVDLQLQDAGAAGRRSRPGNWPGYRQRIFPGTCRVALWDIDPQVTAAAEKLKSPV